MIHLKTGKGVSSSIIQPRDVGSSNSEVVIEGKEVDSVDKVHYPGRLGVFGVDDGYNRLIVAPHQDTLPRPGGAPQDTCQVDGE